MAGLICKELQHLPLPRKKICIATDSIANLLSMGKLVKEGFRVTMDSDGENALNVYNDDGSYIKFVCVQDGLYCINLDNSGVVPTSLLRFPNRRNISLRLITRRLP